MGIASEDSSRGGESCIKSVRCVRAQNCSIDGERRHTRLERLSALIRYTGADLNH